MSKTLLIKTLTEAALKAKSEADVFRYHRQSRDEKDRRLLIVQQLAIELAAIKKHTYFCYAFAQDALAHVFNGEWAEIDLLLELLNSENPIYKSSQSELVHYDRFVLLLRSAKPSQGDA